MINLETKKKYHDIKLFFTLFYISVSIFFIISIFIAVIFIKQENSVFFLFFAFVVYSIILTSIILIVDSILLHIFKYKNIDEQIELCSSISLPNTLPKVVFLYLCHNDFDSQALLKSSNQTYNNFEIWISDGSDDICEKKKIDEFAKSHNKFNVFRLGENGSNTKAENINAFLKYSGVNFDYLLICDADEVINPLFVENAIKLFYCKKIQNLQYVSCVNDIYSNGNLFGELTSSSIIFFNEYKTLINKTFLDTKINNLYSCCCLIKKDMLLLNDNAFPMTETEDVSFELFASHNEIDGFLLSITPSFCKADNSYKKLANRLTRVESGSISEAINAPLAKTTLTNKNDSQRNYWFIIISIPFWIFLFPLLFTYIWIHTNDITNFVFYIYKNNFILLISLFFSLLSLFLSFLLFVLVRFGTKKDIIFYFFSNLSCAIFMVSRGFTFICFGIQKIIFRKQYNKWSDFKKFDINFQKTLIFTIVTLILFVGVIISYCFFNVFLNKNYNYLLIYIYLLANTIIYSCLLVALCQNIMFFLSKISKEKHHQNHLNFLNNRYCKFFKSIKKFNDENIPHKFR